MIVYEENKKTIDDLNEKLESTQQNLEAMRKKHIQLHSSWAGKLEPLER